MTTAIAKVRSFPESGVAASIPETLREVESAGFRALYAPEFGQARIQNTDNSELIRGHQTLTGIYTGRTAGGTRVVAFAHIQHYLTQPGNIEAAIDSGLVNGAAATPQVAAEMPRLLKLEGQDVFVIPYDDWERIESGMYTLKKALQHPVQALTTAFLGGRQNAENYLQQHQLKIFGDEIGIWKADDPDGTARLAVFSGRFDGSLDANGRLDIDRCFAAAPNGLEGKV